MYKRLFCVFLSVAFTVLCAFPAYAENDELALSARAAILMTSDTLEVVYAKNEHERLPMASTTKIMSALLALEYKSPDEAVTVTKEAVSVEGTSMGLLPGDCVSVKTLACGMLLSSGNDAANVAAYAVSGGLDEFTALMNQRAKEFNMNDTSFETPSGLDSENHYSTAYDMALLGAEAIKNPEFLSICSKKSMSVSYGNPPYRRTVTNHNRLLTIDEDCIGIKTGFTKKSGRCLVSAVRRGGVTLIAVTLNAPDDWNDHEKMYNYGFSVVKNRSLFCDLSGVRLCVVGSDKSSVGVKPLYTPYLASLKNIEPEIKICIKNFEYAPVESGKNVGTVYYLYDGRVLSEVPIVTSEGAEYISDSEKMQKKSLPQKIKKFFRKVLW